MLFRPTYTIRLARRGDLHLLPKIERVASNRFAEYGLAKVMFAAMMSIEQLEERQADDRLWVAANSEGRPVGFAAASIIDSLGHLDELDVVPAHGRRGLGKRLLDKVCVWAWRSACSGVTLSTTRGIPFNEPFYRGCGFENLTESDLSPGLLRLREAERHAGLPMDKRTIMRRVF